MFFPKYRGWRHVWERIVGRMVLRDIEGHERTALRVPSLGWMMVA